MLKIPELFKASKTDVSINTRIPEEIYNQCKKLSLETGYSFNGLILYAMHYALKDNEKKKYKTDKSDISVNVRIPSEIHGEYKKMKEKLGRSINSLIVSAMYYFLDNIEK